MTGTGRTAGASYPLTLNPCTGRPRLMSRRRRYGIGKLLIDLALTLLTGGLWLLVVLFRELRARQ